MRRLWISGIVYAFILLLTACETKPPLMPEGIVGVKPHFENLQEQYTATESDLFAVAFEISVQDDDELPAANIPVHLYVSEGYGEIAAQDFITDDAGYIRALYYCICRYDEHLISLTTVAGEDTSKAGFSLQGLPAARTLAMVPEQDTVHTRFGVGCKSAIQAAVTNCDGVPVPNAGIFIHCENKGIDIPSYTVTDKHGLSEIQVDFHGTGFGEFTIHAQLECKQENVSVSNIDPKLFDRLGDYFLPDSLQYTGSRNSKGFSSAEIQVQLRAPAGLHFMEDDCIINLSIDDPDLVFPISLFDLNEQPINNELITITSNCNAINLSDSIRTDEFGLGKVTATANGQTGVAVIDAWHAETDRHAQMKVWITGQGPPECSINLTNPGAAVWTGFVSQIPVVVRYPDGGPGVNFPVRLHSRLNDKHTDEYTTNNNGSVYIPFIPHNPGRDQLSLTHEEFELENTKTAVDVYSDPIEIRGEFIDLQSPYWGDFKLFDFQVRDRLGQPVAHLPVELTCSGGILSDISVTTDGSGRGQVKIFRNNHEKGGKLYISSRTCRDVKQFQFIRVPSGSFDFSFSSHEFRTAGNGESSLDITVVLRDAEGEVYGEQSTVLLELVNSRSAPLDAHFDNGESSVLVPVQDGSAQVRLHAGDIPGSVMVRATTWQCAEGEDVISVMLSTIPVMPKEPDF